MPNLEEKIVNSSKIVLQNKKDLCLSGVTKFISATDTMVSLILSGDEFVVEGNNLVVLNLDTDKGELLLTGEVNKLYFDAKGNKFSFKKLFNR